MIAINCQLDFDPKDTETINDLCRRWSSAMRTAYKHLNINPDQNLHQLLQDRFNLNYRYAHTAIVEAEALISSRTELGEKPHKAIFGSKKLFYKLKKKHLSQKQRDEIKEQYRETRQCHLYSIGDKTCGNVNIRLMGNSLRITVGFRKYIYATIHTKDKRWNKVIESSHYTVKINRINGQYYGHFSFTESVPEPTVDYSNGAIGLDLNANPANIAYAEVDKEGNLVSTNTISAGVLYDGNEHQRTYKCYELARQIVELAKNRNKAIVLEDLHLSGLNRALSNFCYAKLRTAIEVTAARNGVMTKAVWASYTSMIGCLKYAPMYDMSRHTSAALVIARRGLGFKDKLPKNYVKVAEEQLAKKPRRNKKKAKQSKSSASGVNSNNVTRRKKEVDLSLKQFSLVYKVCRTASSVKSKALTGHHTGWRALRNWSILKEYLFHGESDGMVDLVLAPPFGGGAVQRCTEGSKIAATQS